MTTISPSFNDLVADAVITHTHFSPLQLIIPDNSTKYRPKTFPTTINEQNLSAIFDTMANINRAALEDPNLCAGPSGSSFRQALLEATTKILTFANHRPIRYIELGPEPWKSRLVLQHLLVAGIQLRQYIGIDINPQSEEAISQALVPIIGADRFTYLIKDFHECSQDDFPSYNGGEEDDCVTVVTNLGFQEGNDLPSRIGPMLKRLVRPGDLLLSEMQVFKEDDERESKNTIKQFYHIPEMQRFSALVGQRFDPSILVGSDNEGHEYMFNLLQIQTEVGVVNVATTLVSVKIDGKKMYVLTNSCLKYTAEQFRRVREKDGKWLVKAELETGDRSVVFQISERCEV